MNHHALIELAGILVLGTSAQWLAWRFKLPSILLLLTFGFLAGPVFHLLHPDELLGTTLFPIVSLSVAVILFEGGLTLTLRELRQIGRQLWPLVSVGVLVGWVLGTAGAYFLLGFSRPIAILTGALLVVTGPTVVLPLLRLVRPKGRAGVLAKWEGILNDPIGVLLAVLVFEAILGGSWKEGAASGLLGFLETFGIGTLLGLAGAGVLVVLMRAYHVPDFLQSPATLMLVLAVYAASDLVQPESGLFSVTVMGVALANQRFVEVKHIIEFKENLRVLLIGSLFIILAARIKLEDLTVLGWGSVLFVLALVFIVRPATVFLSMLGSKLTWKEQAFLAWMAPRGIVAAATASVFAIRLAEEGYPEADRLLPVVFLVIVSTVALYGLTATPVARWLGIAGGQPQGVMILGAHFVARSIAEAIQQAGFPVLLVDNNRTYVKRAKMAGLTAHHGNALSEELPEYLSTEEMGHFLAMTSNDEVNSLASIHYEEMFGERATHQLWPDKEESEGEKGEATVPKSLRGHYLFKPGFTWDEISSRVRAGWTMKTTKLSDEYTYENFVGRYGEDVVVFFVLRNNELRVSPADAPLVPKAGDTIMALVHDGEAEA